MQEGHKLQPSVFLRSTRYAKKRRDPKHLKESLAVFVTPLPDEKGEPVKSSTLFDALTDSAKWLAVDVSSGGKLAEYVYLLGLCGIQSR